MKIHELVEAKTPSDTEKEAWETSKWMPKKLSSDTDPYKATFEALFADAFKKFPGSIREIMHAKGYGVGGNGIFDSIYWTDFGEPFEDEICSGDVDTDPEELHANLLKVAEFLTELESTVIKLKDGYDKFYDQTKKPMSRAGLVRAHKLMKGLQLQIGSKTIEFLSHTGGEGDEVEFNSYLPLYVHLNGKHSKYPTIPTSGVPHFYDARYMMGYIWKTLYSTIGAYELFTGYDINKLKIKIINQPQQPTEKQLVAWFGSKD